MSVVNFNNASFDFLSPLPLCLSLSLRPASAPKLRLMRGQSLMEGDKLYLKCEASGNPSPSFRWYKDGHELQKGRDLKIKTNKWVCQTGCISYIYTPQLCTTKLENVKCKWDLEKGSRPTWRQSCVETVWWAVALWKSVSQFYIERWESSCFLLCFTSSTVLSIRHLMKL